MSKTLKHLVAAPLALMLLAGCDVAPKYEFDLTRLAADGSVYKGNGNYLEQPWACVRDNKSGLTWEVKTAAPGLHAGANTYTWYDLDEHANLGYEGKPNGGVCTGSDCDTRAFVTAVNAERLCGYTDWHVPSSNSEMSTIIDTAAPFPGPTLPKGFFPNAKNDKSGYWSATAFESHKSGAWAWRLDHGGDFIAMKDEPRYVMLVHGAAKTSENQKPAQ